MCDGHVLNYYMNGQLMAYVKNGMNIVDEAYMLVYYRHVYNCLLCFEGQGHFVDIGALGTSKDKGHVCGTRTCEGTTSRDIPQSRCGVNFADEISVSWEVCNTLYSYKNPR